jgi:hypothetical protein
MSFQVGVFQTNFQQNGVAPPVAARPSGGIGHGKRRKRHFLERDGEILLFDKAVDVEIYLYQESLVKEEPKKVKRSIKRAKKVEPQVINKEALQKFVEVQEIPENVYELASVDIDLLLDISRKYEMWMDEQDVEILLLH